MFAAIKEPFFQGSDNYDQLEKITKVLGTAELFDYVDKYEVQLEKKFESVLGKHSKKSWDKFIKTENKRFCSDEALDLLSKMLVYDHALRITPKDAMVLLDKFYQFYLQEHPYLQEIAKENQLKNSKFEKLIN